MQRHFHYFWYIQAQLSQCQCRQGVITFVMYCNILWLGVFITVHGLGLWHLAIKHSNLKMYMYQQNFFLNIYSVKKHSYCDQNFISLIDYFTNKAQLYIVQIIYISIDCKMCWYIKLYSHVMVRCTFTVAKCTFVI